MNDLAHWIIAVGTGVIYGIAILGIGSLFVALAQALPDRVPVLTPTWERIKGGVQWIIDRPIHWLDRKIGR